MPVLMMPSPRSSSQANSAASAGAAGRRRGTPVQGRALELLGHAVEYLVDSRLFVLDAAAARSDAEAVQILMRCSRAVFVECPEVISLQRRLRLWLVDRLSPADEAGRRALLG